MVERIDDRDIPIMRYEVTTQNGERFFSNYITSGNYVEGQRQTYGGDWAIYSVPDNFNFIASVQPSDIGQLTGRVNARVIGYGALKIMSDADIANFKLKYIKYLKDERGIISNGTESKYGWSNSNGMYNDSTYVKNFLSYLWENNRSYYTDVFEDDNRLKVSKCYYNTVDGEPVNCQVWTGNSGGGIFDDRGNIMGIVTRGYPYIGGISHAMAEGSVNLLRSKYSEGTR